MARTAAIVRLSATMNIKRCWSLYTYVEPRNPKPSALGPSGLVIIKENFFGKGCRGNLFDEKLRNNTC